jgi:proline racemase
MVGLQGGRKVVHWSKVVTVVGAHAEGEVGRVITGGVLGVPGATMLEKMRWLDADDQLRRFVMWEPRGHPQMAVNLLVPPCAPEADAGFVVMQVDGCHTMSGSNAMCVTTVLLETGMLAMREPTTRVVLDTPAGLVTAEASCAGGRVERVALQMVPSFALHLDHPLEVAGLGTLAVDVACGGDWFCLVDASALGFRVVADEARDMVKLGAQIKHAARDQIQVRHPEIEGLDRIGFVLFAAPPEAPGGDHRNANVMAPGRLDRSPCGTGTSARLAVMHARGQVVPGDLLTMCSVIGTSFQAEIIDTARVGGRAAVVPRISGRAWVTGIDQLGVDPSDPMGLGFTVPDVWGST